MRHVIIGASAAGVSAVESLLQYGDHSEVAVISDESLVYSRPLLSYYLAGKLNEEEILYRSRQFFNQPGLETYLERAASLDLDGKKVVLESGRAVPYDRLVIATGASPRFPRAAGITKPGVFGLRRIEDVQGMLSRVAGVRQAVVLGAGLVGLKAAAGLRKHGIDVTVLVGSKQVLSQMLDASSAAVFQEIFEKHGVRFVMGVKPVSVLGELEIEGVQINTGEVFPCQMVVAGKGVDPNLRIVENTPIEVDYGIVVDEHCQTNIEGVYGAGDVVQAMDVVRGESWINALWPCAVEQGRIAALNMLGERTDYKGSMRMNSVQFFDLPVISAGLAVLTPGPLGARSGEHDEVVEERPSELVYRKVFLKDNTIVGFVAIGEFATSGLLRVLMEKKVDISPIRDRLLSPHLNLGSLLPYIAERRDRFPESEFQELVESVGV